MRKMRQISRYFETVRHLRASQTWGRLWFRIYKPKPDLRPAPSLRERSRQWIEPPAKPVSLVEPDVAFFLNHEADISATEIWQDKSQPLLWLYNLHYFDDLAAAPSSARLSRQMAFVDRWIKENPPPTGIGWQPYPTSLRIVNWIKWHIAHASLSENALTSLAVQVRHLAKRLEYHILGNHLLANAKALFFAGAFFSGTEGDHLLRKARRLLERQIAEQVLPDGAHFELSPMYHLIVLEDLLDILNISDAYGVDPPAGIKETVSRMLGWSRVMRHGDGDIPFFNDASFDIAQPPEALDSYAQRLGLEPAPVPSVETTLSSSGYARISSGIARVFFDTAAVGPDYLPGHAHADTLSIEFSIGSDRIVVNGGTSVYGTGPERHRQRGTAAHSTIVLDSEDSSDVWAGFRVGRRAAVIERQFTEAPTCTILAASHDGYVHLPGAPVHRREVSLENGRLQIIDVVSGTGRHRIESRIHLHPDLTAQSEANGVFALVAPSGRVVRVHGEAETSCHSSTWHPGFGKTIRSNSLEIIREADLPQTFRFTLTWDP